MNQHSNNSNKSGLTTRSGKVNYELCELPDGCDHPQCDTRRKYGIRVKKVRTDYLMSSISVITYSSTKRFCPKHRPDTPVTQDAINKEHEEAVEEWNRKKQQRNNQEYEKIINSNIIPIFKYRASGSLLCEQEDRFYATNFETIDDSIQFLINASIDIPVVLTLEQEPQLYIIESNGSVEEYSTEDKIIEFSEFKQRFSKYEFSKRQLLSVRSNILTGTNYDKTPVRKLEDIVDDIIEWHEYFEANGHLKPYRCPACGSDSIYSGKVNYSRVIIDGEEKIVPTHKQCNKIMGELNLAFIDEESYELDK